jgi:Acetyltransferase (GNAT) domain
MLTTEHPGLVLQELTTDHAGLYYALVDTNRSHLTAHGDYPEMLDVSLETVALDLRELEDDVAFGVWLHDDLIGRVDLVRKDAHNFVLGYWLDSGYTGHGYATYACLALIEHARLLGALGVSVASRRGMIQASTCWPVSASSGLLTWGRTPGSIGPSAPDTLGMDQDSRPGPRTESLSWRPM